MPRTTNAAPPSPRALFCCPCHGRWEPPGCSSHQILGPVDAVGAIDDGCYYMWNWEHRLLRVVPTSSLSEDSLEYFKRTTLDMPVMRISGRWNIYNNHDSVAR